MFSLWFPLLAGNTLDKLIHPRSTFLLHLLRYVAIDVQRKSGGGVAQVALYRLDIIPATA